MGALCALLGVIHAGRTSGIRSPPPLESGSTIYNLERQVGYGATGTTFRLPIKRHHWQTLEDSIGGHAVLAPIDVEITPIKNASGEIFPARILSSDAQIAYFFNQTRGRLDEEHCANGLVLFDPRFRSRLGIEIGSTVKVGDRPVEVGEDLRLHDIALNSDGSTVDAVRCSRDPFIGNNNEIGGGLLLAPAWMAANLKDRLSKLTMDDGAFQERWTLAALDHLIETARQRRFGWLLGLELLVGGLTLGACMLLRILSRMSEGDEATIRRALGEQSRHRFRRRLRNDFMQFVQALLTTVPLSFLGSVGLNRLYGGETDPEAASGTALLYSVIAISVITLLIAAVDRALDLAPMAKKQKANGIRTTPKSRPARLAAIAATTLCGGICVPSAFLLAELTRHQHIDPGYQTTGIHSSKIHLVNYRGTPDRTWWERLRVLKSEIESLPGIAMAAYISPAPWDYIGAENVVAGEDGMLLNVGVSEDALRLLSPSGWVGRDIAHDEQASEIFIQNMDDEMKRHFIQPGTTIVGEINGMRFSPLDEVGRSAIFRSIQAGIGNDIQLIVSLEPGAELPHDVLNQALSRYKDMLIAAPAESVSRIIAGRFAPLRASATMSAMVAAAAIGLLGVVLVGTARVYAQTNRRSLAIQMCLGAPPVRLQIGSVVRCCLATGLGWSMGTLLGLSVWHQIVFLIRDHRLTQPWPSYWLLLAMLAIVAPYYWLLIRHSISRISISEALKA